MTEDIFIDGLGPKGDGVHWSPRGAVFIDRALPGDTVQARIHAAGDVLRGDLIKVVSPSPHRILAPCVHYDVCGGCTLQHADETFYRNWKVEIVRSALRKKDLEPVVWCEPVFLPAGSRRRATFASSKKKNAVTLGYFRRRSHEVTDIVSCLVADPAIMALRATLVTALVPILQEGKDADVFIQAVGGQFEIVITGPVGKKGVPDYDVHEGVADLVQKSGVARISWRTREREEPEVLLEAGPLRAKFGALNVALPPLAFLQPTKAGEAALVEAVMKLLPKSGKFADLFSGSGTFSGPMLERGAVDAYDSASSAVRALDKAKGTKPLKVIQRDLFRQPLRGAEIDRYDAVVFDPPRAGAKEQVKALASSKVGLLVAISCDPTSFARDALILVDGGYKLASIIVVDQFTWSHHVELAASFTRL